MSDAIEAPQEYKFQNHEFTDINAKEKGGHSFNLQIFEGKAFNNIKTSIVAQDLLVLLQSSGKAVELSQTGVFEFMMDKQYMLHISYQKQEEEEEVPETEETETAEGAE